MTGIKSESLTTFIGIRTLGIFGAAALGLFFFNLGRAPEADSQNEKFV